MAASKQMVAAVVAMIATVVFLPALASATEHVVGDAHGWTLGFDYDTWSQTKQFTVGDTLVFKYSTSSHDVVEVSGKDFKACNKVAATSVWSSGEDRVVLDKPGRRWFVCAVGEHCRNGMKLNVTVLPAPAPAPAPVSGSYYSGRAGGVWSSLSVPAPAPAPASGSYYSRRAGGVWSSLSAPAPAPATGSYYGRAGGVWSSLWAPVPAPAPSAWW